MVFSLNHLQQCRWFFFGKMTMLGLKVWTNYVEMLMLLMGYTFHTPEKNHG